MQLHRALSLSLLLLLCGMQMLMLATSVKANEAGTEGTTIETPLKPSSGTANALYTDEERKEMEEKSEKFEFQAEISRVMDIIIHSLYSKKDIFLREIISNASDANDKIRFISLTDPDKLGGGDLANLDIRIEVDKEAKTLSITDKGIGMTKQELIANLGTIAKSGTSSFLEAMQKTQDLNLIGQFGVGFYSVYLVADSVTVTSVSLDGKQHIWTSSAESTFTVVEDPKGNTLGRGTRITMHLKEDAASEFTDVDNLRTLIRKYSEFISFPIYIMVEKEVDVEVPADEEDAEKKEGEEDAEKKEDETEEKKKDEDDVEVSDADEEEGKEKKKKTKTIKEKKREWELVNQTKAIWLRNPKDVTKEEYNNFFKSLTKEFDDPLDYIHFSAEGEIEFKAILFVPKKAPHDIFDKMTAKQNNLKLYVRRVFISDEFEDLIPRYLSFIRGVVDSEDLPLNVSREMLQQSRVLKVIKKKIVSKALDMLKRLSESEEKAVKAIAKAAAGESDDKAKEEEEKKKEEEEEEEGDDDEEEEEEEDDDHEKVVKRYNDFHKEFSKSIKLGIIEDSKNRKKLANFLRYESTATKSGETVSLTRYVARMKEGQKHIYYIAGDSRTEVEASPYLEKLKKRGYEVLFFVDPIDSYTAQHLDEFDDKRLVDVTKEDLKFGDKKERKEKKRLEKAKEEYKDLISWYKDLLKDKVEKVVLSNRLTTSPVAVVTGTYGYTAHMERLMKAQALNDQSRYSFMSAKKTLEINVNHKLIKSLLQKVKDAPEDDATKEVGNVLFDTALITAGFTLDETQSFASRIYGMLKAPLNVDSLDVEEEAEDDDSADEEEEEKKEAAKDDDSSSNNEAEEGDNNKGGDDDSSSNNNNERKDEL